MKILSMLVFAITIVAGAGTDQGFSKGPTVAKQTNATDQIKKESPFACNVAGLTPQERKRHFEELGPKLRSLHKAVRELTNGYEFEFQPDPSTVMLLAEWSAKERQCCPFFDIAIRFECEGGPVFLRLTGRDGVTEFIRSDFSAWFPR